jgi:phosphoglycolate phosphatase/putative hydrolase of the HAD superfamily
MELDGQCAINAGSPYLIVEKKPYNSFDFYNKLEADLSHKVKERETSSSK